MTFSGLYQIYIKIYIVYVKIYIMCTITLNESYNLPQYILASSLDNKSKASSNFSFIQRVNPCQNTSSNFNSKESLLLE